ncbi:hypothetical protein C0992_000336 [Termitomyces sp. T32_za158]|nr:hypothetical protein C0992_000336 [Termitomyces sp. T32_za158]
MKLRPVVHSSAVRKYEVKGEPVDSLRVLYQDIDNQGSAQQELYWYMNSNHEQTETYRTGFFGPYAMAITTGAAPSANLDTSFMDSLGLQGYVPASGRGTVTGTYSGTLSGLAVTIGFKVEIVQKLYRRDTDPI